MVVKHGFYIKGGLKARGILIRDREANYWLQDGCERGIGKVPK